MTVYNINQAIWNSTKCVFISYPAWYRGFCLSGGRSESLLFASHVSLCLMTWLCFHLSVAIELLHVMLVWILSIPGLHDWVRPLRLLQSSASSRGASWSGLLRLAWSWLLDYINVPNVSDDLSVVLNSKRATNELWYNSDNSLNRLSLWFVESDAVMFSLLLFIAYWTWTCTARINL